MAGTTNASNQVLEAMVWYYGKRECRSVTFVDDTAGSNAGDSWDINVITEDYAENKLLFWMDDGVAAAPTPAADQTLVAVTYTQGDSAAVQAGLFETAAELNDMIATVSGDTVTYENAFLGVITAEDMSNAPLFTFAPLQTGTGGSLGAIAVGGATVTTEQSLEDILRDDEGDVLQDQIIKGASVSASLGAAEMDTDNWESLVRDSYGDSHTVGSDELIGYGTSKLYQSSFSFAGQLVGHPKRLANSDRSADIVFWKATASMEEINYAGDAVQVGSFSFQSLPDRNKPDAINLFARGDHSLL